MTTLSLCICTMNRPDELATALASVRSGTVQPDELIVSDDGDGSAAEVAARFEATYQRGPRRGLGPNRNACIASATGQAVAFIDDDVVVSTEFVERAVAAARPDVVVTGWELNFGVGEGRKVTPHNPDFLGFQRLDPAGEYRGIVVNATVFPSRLFDTARFDEQIRYGYEEIDIARQAVRLGFPIVFDDDLWVEHHPSSVNRGSYNDVLAASRIYITHRAYRYYEGRPAKAALFAVTAGAHHLAHAVRSGAGLRKGAQTLRTARAYNRASTAPDFYRG
ncbi:glycosyltransferase family 2 protein [Nocardioides sp. CPCC 205120]|uniref:glycosyltransferase family 2 protein n=1 Tax=Nocardioides sp. CPCC 205120 TaxID=3406462 RepID=UPI003B5067EB